MIHLLGQTNLGFNQCTIEECLNYCNSLEVVSVDTETKNLNILDPNNLLLIQMGDDKHQYVLDVRYFDTKELLPFFKNSNIKKVFHNSDFDLNILNSNIKGFKIKNVYCTYKAHKVLTCGLKEKHSMAAVYEKYYNEKLDKTIRDDFIKVSGDFKKEHIEYAGKDVEYTHKIHSRVDNLLLENDLKKTLDLELAVPYWEISRNGIKLDPDKWMDNFNRNKNKLNQSQVDIDKHLIDKHPKIANKILLPLSLFDFDDTRLLNINWGSSDQVKDIFKQLDLEPTDKHGKFTTDKKAVEKLARFGDKNNEFLWKYMDYANTKAFVNTFGGKYLSNINPISHRIHPSFDPIKSTGRMGQMGPNLQQVPSLQEFRDCFVSKEGFKIITCDYPNQEGRIMAHMAKEHDYVDFFNNGDGDAHSYVATKLFSAMFKKEFIVTKYNENKEYRQKGKILNFFISYGGSAFTLSKELNLPIEECQQLIDSFYEAFPGLLTFFKKNQEFALENGYILINEISGRKSFLPEWPEYMDCKNQLNALYKKDPYNYKNTIYQDESLKKIQSRFYKLKGMIERAANNYPIQGSAGDSTKEALIYLNSELYWLNDVLIINVVHDEIVVECPKELTDRVSKIVCNCMNMAGKKYADSIDWNVEAEVSDFWQK